LWQVKGREKYDSIAASTVEWRHCYYDITPAQQHYELSCTRTERWTESLNYL